MGSIVWVIDPFRFSMEQEVIRDYNDWVLETRGVQSRRCACLAAVGPLHRPLTAIRPNAAPGHRRCGGIFSVGQLESFYRWRTGKESFNSPTDFDVLVRSPRMESASCPGIEAPGWKV